MTAADLAASLEPALAARWRELVARLADASQRYPDAALASSLAAEDMVLTHAIYGAGLALEVFTLDTGRLHAETLGVLDAVRARYGREVTVYRPEADAVERHMAEHGAYAFYESVELRKACCQIRKVEPLKRALAGRGAVDHARRAAPGRARPDLRSLQVQPAGRVERGGSLGRDPRARHSLQPAARPGLSVHRLRALYPRHPSGRRPAGRTLVVGVVGLQGMRPACRQPGHWHRRGNHARLTPVTYQEFVLGEYLCPQ
jgi:hypothetical protein